MLDKISNKQQKELLKIRESISDIDESLMSLIAERRKLSIAVAEIKQAINKPLRDQTREQQLLESLVNKASLLGIESRYITALFTTIIKDSVRHQQQYLQAKLTPEIKAKTSKSIAVLGGIGAYSHLAAEQFFNHDDHQYQACDSFKEIIDKVENETVKYGVIPIENTTSGGITEVYDLLLNSSLQIIGEQKLAINHCLVAKPGMKLTEVTKIVAHPQAARQCSEELANKTSAKISLIESTAHALQLVLEKQNTNVAAIASEQAANLFGLTVLRKNLANQRQNFTRFLVLSKKAISVSLSVQSKTTIALSTAQHPGSLAKVLSLFENANIALTKLESRPIPDKPWEQLFYIDFDGNIKDPLVSKTLDKLCHYCKFVKSFGSYPTENITATQVPTEQLANASLIRNQQQSESQLTSDSPTKRIANTEDHKETIVQLAGTYIGKQYFELVANIAPIKNTQQVQQCLNQLSDSGTKILSSKIDEFVECPPTEPMGFKQQFKSIQQLSNSLALSAIISVNNLQQLLQAAEHELTPSIDSAYFQHQSLLESAGSLATPVLLKCNDTTSINELLSAAELVSLKGNQQILLSLEYDLSRSTDNTLNKIVSLKSQTHLPLLIEIKNQQMNMGLLVKLVNSLRTLGVNAVALEVDYSTDESCRQMPLALSIPEFVELMSQV